MCLGGLSLKVITYFIELLRIYSSTGWPATLTNYLLRKEGIQWVFRISRSNVPIAVLPSLSALRSKSSSHLKVILMTPSDVPRAVKPGSQSVTEIAALARGLDAKCSLQYVLSVVKPRKYRLSLARADRCTVAIATVRSKWPDNADLNLTAYIGLDYPAYVCR